MNLIIEQKKIPLYEANTFYKKFKGLMFQKNIHYALVFRCNGIHTFFMREEIDVILTDKNNNILYLYPNFKKWRVLLPKRDVYYTYELPLGSITNKNIKQIKIDNR